MQLACEALGGKVEHVPAREYGRAQLPASIAADPLLDGVLEPTTQVWMSHGDQVTDLSDDFTPLAATDTCPFRRRSSSNACRSTACSSIPR